MERRLFKVKDVAQYLSITPDEVYGKTALGELPYIPHGKRGKRWDKMDLDTYIERSKTRTFS